MTKTGLMMGVAAGAVCLAASAMATEPTPGSVISIEQAASLLHYSSGNDRMRIEVAPNYSEELGWSLKGATGTYISDSAAIGLLVEYGSNKREYLSNLGFQLTDALSLVGSVGMLEEHNEFVDGEAREEIRQMEYGASLKGAYGGGFFNGFELNGYLVDAEADADIVETGQLYGVQLLLDSGLTDTTHLKLGGGYEWLEWQETHDDNSSWAFSAEAVQQLGDALSLSGQAKMGASEYVYSGGVALDFGNGGPNTNTIGVSYSHIDGKNGVGDDQRVELSWNIGFGAGPTTSVANGNLTDKTGTANTDADLGMESPAENLLDHVVKRPGYLPQRVLARVGGEDDGFSNPANCPVINTNTGTGQPGVAIPGQTYFVAYNMNVAGGRLFVNFFSDGTEYLDNLDNLVDVQNNLATVFSLSGGASPSGVAPSSSQFGGGFDGRSIYWDNAEGLFGNPPGSLTLSFSHNGLECRYTLTQQIGLPN